MINSILNKINCTQALKPVNFNKFAAKNISFGANEAKDTFVKQTPDEKPLKRDANGKLIDQELYKDGKWIGNISVESEFGGKTSIRELRKEYNEKGQETKITIVNRDANEKITSTEETEVIYNDKEQNTASKTIRRGADGKIDSTLYQQFSFNEKGEITNRAFVKKDAGEKTVLTRDDQYIYNKNGELAGDNIITKNYEDEKLVSTEEHRDIIDEKGKNIGFNKTLKGADGKPISMIEHKNILDENGIRTGRDRIEKEYKDGKVSKISVNNTTGLETRIKADTEMQYDANGKLEKATTKNSNGMTKIAEFSYAEDGRLDSKKITHHLGEEQVKQVSVKFKYNELGRRAVAVVKRTIPKA